MKDGAKVGFKRYDRADKARLTAPLEPQLIPRRPTPSHTLTQLQRQTLRGLTKMSFQNVYTHRKVAETAAKGCEICYKPSSSVLATPDAKVSGITLNS